MPLDFPGSLYDSLFCQLITQPFNKSLSMLKTYPWEEPHEIFFSSRSERCDLMAQDYILRIREIIPEFG